MPVLRAAGQQGTGQQEKRLTAEAGRKSWQSSLLVASCHRIEGGFPNQPNRELTPAEHKRRLHRGPVGNSAKRKKNLSESRCGGAVGSKRRPVDTGLTDRLLVSGRGSTSFSSKSTQTDQLLHSRQPRQARPASNRAATISESKSAHFSASNPKRQRHQGAWHLNAKNAHKVHGTCTPKCMAPVRRSAFRGLLYVEAVSFLCFQSFAKLSTGLAEGFAGIFW